jgi:hypothetical protein
MADYPQLGKEDHWASKVNDDAQAPGGNCARLAVGPHYDYTTRCVNGQIVIERKADWTTSTPNGSGGCDVEQQFSILPILTGESCDPNVSYPLLATGGAEWNKAMREIEKAAKEAAKAAGKKADKK